MNQLRLGPVADDKPVKLTIELPGQLMRELKAYGDVHARLNERTEALPPERLIPAMIERFIASDRGFARARRQR